MNAFFFSSLSLSALQVERFRLVRETLELWEVHHLKPKLPSAMRCIVEELLDQVCGGQDQGQGQDQGSGACRVLSDHSESSAVADDGDYDDDGGGDGDNDNDDDRRPSVSSALALEEYEALEREEYEAMVHIVSHKINFWDMSFKEQAKSK